uniref:CSON003382 protein n=1 Tax=Culicoides sonorensis TaxID=179676 RepID=A0A336MN72_CULSO
MQKSTQSLSPNDSSIEHVNKGVSTLNQADFHGKKIETIIQLDENFSSTTSSENPSSMSTQAESEYYRLTSNGRPKFMGKSPSKLEFQLIRKSAAASKVNRKKVVKGNVDFITKTDICACKSKSALRNELKQDLNSSWSQKLKRMFETCNRDQSNDPQDKDFFELDHEPEGELKSKAKNSKVIKYDFEHGCPEYYKTFDCPPHLISDMLAEQTVHHATRFWAEMFGFINIGVTFFVTFLLQFYR